MNTMEILEAMIGRIAPGAVHSEAIKEDELHDMLKGVQTGGHLEFCLDPTAHTCKIKHHTITSHIYEARTKFPRSAIVLSDMVATVIFANLGFISQRTYRVAGHEIHVSAEKQAAISRGTGKIVYYKTLDDLLADYDVDGLRIIKLEREVAFLSSQMQILLNHIAYSPGGPGYVESMKDFTERK